MYLHWTILKNSAVVDFFFFWRRPSWIFIYFNISFIVSFHLSSVVVVLKLNIEFDIVILCYTQKLYSDATKLNYFQCSILPHKCELKHSVFFHMYTATTTTTTTAPPINTDNNNVLSFLSFFCRMTAQER